ncbi:MAG: metal ABC transporter permease, partial [Oscillospiraceae bacterium]
HTGSEEEALECGVENIPLHLHWESKYAARMIRSLEHAGYIKVDDGLAKLTEDGRSASIRNYNALFSE